MAKKRVVKAETYEGLDIFVDPKKSKPKEKPEEDKKSSLSSQVTTSTIAGVKKLKLGEED